MSRANHLILQDDGVENFDYRTRYSDRGQELHIALQDSVKHIRKSQHRVEFS